MFSSSTSCDLKNLSRLSIVTSTVVEICLGFLTKRAFIRLLRNFCCGYFECMRQLLLFEIFSLMVHSVPRMKGIVNEWNRLPLDIREGFNIFNSLNFCR